MSGRHTGHFRINVFCLDHAILVILMNDRLICHNKSRSHLHRIRPEHHRCRKSASICDTTGCNHRNRYCINYLRNQRHRCLRTDMSARLGSFCNDRIRAAALHQFGKCHTRDNGNHFDSSFLPHLHVFCRISSSSRNNLNAFLHKYLGNRICIRIHQHQIDTKWLIRLFLRSLDLLAHPGCRSTTSPYNAKTASV